MNQQVKDYIKNMNDLQAQIDALTDKQIKYGEKLLSNEHLLSYHSDGCEKVVKMLPQECVSRLYLVDRVRYLRRQEAEA